MSDEERRQPPLSPLYGDFTGFPPALMFAAELDPLRDDTLELAERWGRAAEVEVHLLPETAHGVIHFPLGLAGRVVGYGREWVGGRVGEG